jgi:hypothetical protein
MILDRNPLTCRRFSGTVRLQLGNHRSNRFWMNALRCCKKVGSTCFYTWRSTEPEENTNPDKYPAVFRLQPENLPKLQVAPSIPPLRPTKP